jgi:hypothetical protein
VSLFIFASRYDFPPRCMLFIQVLDSLAPVVGPVPQLIVVPQSKHVEKPSESISILCKYS